MLIIAKCERGLKNREKFHEYIYEKPKPHRYRDPQLKDFAQI